MSADSALLQLADEQYVLLTTIRRSGVAVPTPVWVGRDGESLIVTTGAEAGKVKRIRHTSVVTLQACDRVGRPREGAVVVEARAIVEEHDEARDRLHEIFREKYGVQYAAIRALSAARGRGAAASVVVRIIEA